MNIWCFYNFVIKKEVHRRAGILGNNTIEAQVESGTDSCVYAHVAHSATDYEIVNLRIRQDFQ
jgi:hypothetical protein